MDINELQDEWGEQDNTPYFSVNESALKRDIERMAKPQKESLRMLQWGAMLTLFFLGAKSLVSLKANPDPRFLYLSFAITFSVGIFHAWKLWQRHRFELTFDDSLKGIIEKSISRIDYTISLIKSLVWAFALPLFTLPAFNYYFYGNPKMLIGAGALFAVFLIASYIARSEIRTLQNTQRQYFVAELEKLKNTN